MQVSLEHFPDKNHKIGLNVMELRHLKYFVTVAEAKSFTKAAEKLFIAQPPLSRQIQNLEQELGVELFQRGQRPLQMTPAGEFFYQHAVKLLANAEGIKSLTKRFALTKQTLKIGFVGSLLYGLLPRVLYLYRQQQPLIHIELIEMTSATQIDALKSGHIDVGFGRLRLSDADIQRILLRQERLMVAIHASHPLAQQQGLWLHQLVNEALFLYPQQSQPSFANYIKNLFSEYGLEPDQLREVCEIQLALGLVAAGEGICIVPESMQTLQFQHLCYLPILDKAAVSHIFMLTRYLDQSEQLRQLCDCIYQVYDLAAVDYDRAVI